MILIFDDVVTLGLMIIIL